MNDGLNFLLTNRIPRRLASAWTGRISRSENPLIRAVALWTWQRFTTLDLSDAEHTRFRSMHDCFTRRLRPGARPIDARPAILASPCDAIVGASGVIETGRALQVKGMDYPLADLLDDPALAVSLEGGTFITLRLTSAMYHRFHAPHDGRVRAVRHVFGDRWNVNPPALRRIRHLFCRNERAILQFSPSDGGPQVVLVAVAAILVSGIRLAFLDLPANRQATPCDAAFTKGQEMGWFEHGSTIVLLTPQPVPPEHRASEGQCIRMGAALLRRSQEPAQAAPAHPG